MSKLLSKLLSGVTAAVFAFVASSESIYVLANEIEENEPKTNVIYGDVNDSGSIDALDLSHLKMEILDLGSTLINREASDVNFDGRIDMKDTLELQDYLLLRRDGFSNRPSSEEYQSPFDLLNRTRVTQNVNGKAVFSDETQMTQDMATLAEKLGTPDEVFSYILNNYKTEFYYGSRKGAIGTFEEGGGNDYDLSSFMIAMLRYLGYTANHAVRYIILTDDDLVKMTAASDAESAKRIFTANNKTLTPYENGGYITEQAMVQLVLDDDKVLLDPSFKYYTKRENAPDLRTIMTDLNAKYDLSDMTLDLYDVSAQIETDYGSMDIVDTFQQYEIIPQDINNLITYSVPDNNIQVYESSLPIEKSDMVVFNLGGSDILNQKSCVLYGKDITLEYQFTPMGAEMIYDGYGYDSIDDLTGSLGPYISWAQIHGVLKIDGKATAYHEGSDILGTKEMLKINVTSAGNTTVFKKEMTFGGLYSIVFDYHVISPYEIADGYQKLVQSSTGENTLTESNVFGSRAMMNMLTLLGKTYFSQIDTNNAMLSYFSDMNYERGLSIAVVDFTPDIYMQIGYPSLNRQGKVEIDVLGNYTIFNSLNGDIEEEHKIRHSSGYVSSFYESETVKQFTGLESVSTADVFNRAAEKDIDILYLSKANINKLEASNLSTKYKEEITEQINNGMYVTVPAEEITINSWKGIGYIVYDPITESNTYVITSNLRGGSLVSWVGLAYFCDILATLVECSWAFDIVMLGAALLGTGLILFTGPIGIAAFAFTSIGLGLILSGGFYIRNIGDRLYSQTELMELYLEGNEEAGELLKLNAGTHVLSVGITAVTMDLMSKGISAVFANEFIAKNMGRSFANAFSKTKYGVDGALDILNRINPSYVKLLSELIKKSGESGANDISNIYEEQGSEGVEKELDRVKAEEELESNMRTSQENNGGKPEDGGVPEEKGSPDKEGNSNIANPNYDSDGNYTGGRDEKALEELTKDPDHMDKNGIMSETAYEKAVNERKVALRAEEQGLVDGSVVRDPQKGRGDFIDRNGEGQIWDVKGWRSDKPPRGYDFEEATKAIKKEIDKGQNILVDTQHMSSEHIKELMSWVEENGFSEYVKFVFFE